MPLATGHNPIVLLLAGSILCAAQAPAMAVMACTMAMNTVAFNSFDVLAGAEVDGSATGTISCSGAAANTIYRFCINVRAGPDAQGNQRAMVSTAPPSLPLPFNLYQDPGHTLAWGNWPNAYLGGGEQVDLTSNGAGQITGTVTAYAAVPGAQQMVVPGSYLETMAAVSPQTLQYGSKPANGSCPVGASTSIFGFNITGTVAANCNVSTTPLNFGSSSSFMAGSVQSTGLINVQCTNTTPYSVGLSNGQNASGGQRRMSLAGSSYIYYDVYTDPAYAMPWLATTSSTACTSGTSTCILGTGTGSKQAIKVYGKVAPQTSLAAGTYIDTLVVTVTY